MDTWRTAYLGVRELPQAPSGFELQAFFTFDRIERGAIDARQTDAHKLGLALHIGFLRISGRLLDVFRIVPSALWRHLGQQLDVDPPEVASLRALYKRGRTLYDHHRRASEILGFAWMSEGQRRSLVSALRREIGRGVDRAALMSFARQWLYEHWLFVAHARTLRSMVAASSQWFEADLGEQIGGQLDATRLARWRSVLTDTHRSGAPTQTWLWAAPAKHSTRQIADVLERVEFLRQLGVAECLTAIPETVLRRYARRLTARKPSVGARLAEPARVAAATASTPARTRASSGSTNSAGAVGSDSRA